MTRRVDELLQASRVPGPYQEPRGAGLWAVRRRLTPGPDVLEKLAIDPIGLPAGAQYSTLHRYTDATVHVGGEVVMDDTPYELRRHLPILLRAAGRVLVTGLGLGCVVRGLLSIPDVQHVDVVEIDAAVLDLVGPEFEGRERVTLHHGDAARISWPDDQEWDWAWHDLWTEHKDGALHLLHTIVLQRYSRYVRRGQGAWMLPRMVKRLERRQGGELIG